MAQVTLPYTLTAGTPENVNNLMSNLTALRDGVNTIDTAQIANGAVTTAKIGDSQVTAAKLASGAGFPTYETSLPSSPTDGQEIFYAADATNGVIWHLRYRSGSSSSYKWEYVGGAAMTHAVTTDQSTTSGTNADLTTVGPTITAPLAGDYIITARAAARNNTVNTKATIEVTINGSAQGYIAYCDMAKAGQEFVVSTEFKGTVSTASHVVKMMYRTGSGGTANFFDRFMTIRPIQVG